MPAAHAPVEHLDGEHGVAVVAEDQDVPEPKAVSSGELLPAALEVHVAFAVEHHLHVPQATSSAGLLQLNFPGLLAMQQLGKLIRQPLQQRSSSG